MNITTSIRKIRYRNVFMFMLLSNVMFCFRTNGQEISEGLSLERIFSTELDAKDIGRVVWIDDNRFTTLESPAPNRSKEIVLYTANKNEREVIVPAGRLMLPGQSTPVDIKNYSWNHNGARLLIFTNVTRDQEEGTSGDYWMLDLSIWAWTRLGKKYPSQSLKNARFSPNGDKVSYIFNNNLYVEDLITARITQLTFDGTNKLCNGRPKGCNSSMLNLRYSDLLEGTDGYSWSPDGKLISFVQTDYSEVPYFYMINNTESLYPEIIKFPYVKVGQQLPSYKVGIVSSSGGDIKWIPIPGDPTNDYLWQMEWTPDTGGLYLQVLDRIQQNMKIMLVDMSGHLRVVHTESDSAWIEPNNIFWIENGKKFILTSERDGWSHLYLYSRAGALLNLITPGELDVIVVQGVDEKNGWVYYIASPNNPSQRYLYRSAINGKTIAQPVSPITEHGTHLYNMSPECSWAVHTHSSFDTPPVYDLVQLPDHRSVRVLEDNQPLVEKLKKIGIKPVEFFRTDIGGKILLDGYCIKPPDFDPEKKYPLLFYVYGEPAIQTVLDKWEGKQYLWHQMLARQQYLVMSVDNRGTPAPRGRNWRKAIYKQLGILAPKDQAAAARSLIKERKYIDTSKIAVYGHSGGGQMSLHLIFRFPEIYGLAMPSAFVSNQRYYHPSYQERFMGPLAQNTAGYREGSPITWAKQLKGKLLIIHGTGDANVHYQSFEALVNELILHKKRFSMMAYPNRNHGLQEGENTQYHLYDLRTEFLTNHMPSTK